MCFTGRFKTKPKPTSRIESTPTNFEVSSGRDGHKSESKLHRGKRLGQDRTPLGDESLVVDFEPHVDAGNQGIKCVYCLFY